MAGRIRYRECKVCGARRPFVSISARGLCTTHTRMRMEDNNRDLREHRGPFFDYWRRRCLAAFGVVGDDSREG